MTESVQETLEAPEKFWTNLPHTKIAGQSIAIASRNKLSAAMAKDCLNARTGRSPRRARIVFDMNGHGLSLNETNASYREALSNADVVHADGGFLVTLSRWLSPKAIEERSATTDLIHDFAIRAENQSLTFYLLGGTEDVNSRCAEELERIYPNLKIVGRRNGYFLDEDEKGVIAAINAVQPDVLWVGLGKPKEQVFAAQHASHIRAGWIVTCGGCFNYISGDYKRAPEWMQRSNLEWVHRMLTRPRQFLIRYLMTTPHALWIVVVRSIWPHNR